MDDPTDLTWRKSSYSGSNGGNCIEVATAPNMVGVRDSKDPCGPVLVAEPKDWRRFVELVKAVTL
jgi:Domain of unknown function (DUF397)